MTPIAFNPVNGRPLPLPLVLSIDDAHRQWPATPGRTWFFNPWTGKLRDSRDVFSDPWGHALVHPIDPLKAATIEPEECTCFPEECRQQVNETGRTPAGHVCRRYKDWPLKAAPITPNEASGEDWPADGAARAATPFFQVSGYETFADVLQRAYEQAACGKGRDRHADELPFHEQPMQRIEALVGGGFCAGQAIKKIQESGRLDRDAAVRELLGAINYIAGNIIALERARVSRPDA